MPDQQDLGVLRTVRRVYRSLPAESAPAVGEADINSDRPAVEPDRMKGRLVFATVTGLAAIVFTLPKDDMVKGVSRCIKRVGLIHGDDVTTRYRRLDMRCVRGKTDASISVSRSKDE